MAEQDLEYELKLLRKLVDINTTVTNETRNGYAECSEMIRLEAQQLGLGTEVLDGRNVTIDGESRPNVVVSLEGNSDVDVLFITHLDVVPADPSKWKTPPFQLRVSGNRAYGRGAADNKSNIVAAMSAMGELAKGEPEINIKLLVTVDEEIGGRAGIGYLFEDIGIRGNAGVVVDSAPNYISIGASGALWGRFVVKGIGGHSGYPEQADNAPYPKVHGRFTVTMIHAGEKENVIPGECEVRFDRRLTPEEDSQKAKIDLETYLTKLAQDRDTLIEEFEILNSVDGYFTNAKHPFVRHFSSIAKKVVGDGLPMAADLGGNDGANLAKAKIPVVCFGTIRHDTNYHAHNEFVYLKDIQIVRDVLIELGKSTASKFS